MKESTMTNEIAIIDAEIETVDAEIVEDAPIDQLVSDIVDATESDDFTAYGVWRVLTDALEAAGVEKKIPSQMMYNYSKNGLISKAKKGDMKVHYTADEVKAFAIRYVSKHSK
jgi:hypothetical protein